MSAYSAEVSIGPSLRPGKPSMPSLYESMYVLPAATACAVVGSFVVKRIMAVSPVIGSIRRFEIAGAPATSAWRGGPGVKEPLTAEIRPLAASAKPWFPVWTEAAVTVIV